MMLRKGPDIWSLILNDIFCEFKENKEKKKIQEAKSLFNTNNFGHQTEPIIFKFHIFTCNISFRFNYLKNLKFQTQSKSTAFRIIIKDC